MWAPLIVIDQPSIEIGLQLVDCAVDFLAEGHSVEFVQNSAMEALANAVIRHDDFGAPVFTPSLGEGIMVSPSGTNGALGAQRCGQAANRRWAASPSSLHGRPLRLSRMRRERGSVDVV